MVALCKSISALSFLAAILALPVQVEEEGEADGMVGRWNKGFVCSRLGRGTLGEYLFPWQPKLVTRVKNQKEAGNKSIKKNLDEDVCVCVWAHTEMCMHGRDLRYI